MRIILPADPLNTKRADDIYQAELVQFRSQGVSCSLFDFDALLAGRLSCQPAIQQGEQVLYRGWMLKPESYQKLQQLVEQAGARMVTSAEQYRYCHHLPNWYPACEGLTPHSVFGEESQLPELISELGWSEYFVKDFVKSNYSERGSIAKNSDEIFEIISLIKKYRGDIEGGIALRQVEQFDEATEKRFFILHGKPYGPDDEIPRLIEEICKRVDAPFYSADLIKNTAGEWRLVEIGDGQVSDIKSWLLPKFCQIFG